MFGQTACGGGLGGGSVGVISPSQKQTGWCRFLQFLSLLSKCCCICSRNYPFTPVRRRMQLHIFLYYRKDKWNLHHHPPLLLIQLSLRTNRCFTGHQYVVGVAAHRSAGISAATQSFPTSSSPMPNRSICISFFDAAVSLQPLDATQAHRYLGGDAVLPHQPLDATQAHQWSWSTHILLFKTPTRDVLTNILTIHVLTSTTPTARGRAIISVAAHRETSSTLKAQRSIQVKTATQLFLLSPLMRRWSAPWQRRSCEPTALDATQLHRYLNRKAQGLAYNANNRLVDRHLGDSRAGIDNSDDIQVNDHLNDNAIDPPQPPRCKRRVSVSRRRCEKLRLSIWMPHRTTSSWAMCWMLFTTLTKNSSTGITTTSVRSPHYTTQGSMSITRPMAKLVTSRISMRRKVEEGLIIDGDFESAVATLPERGGNCYFDDDDDYDVGANEFDDLFSGRDAGEDEKDKANLQHQHFIMLGAELKARRFKESVDCRRRLGRGGRLWVGKKEERSLDWKRTPVSIGQYNCPNLWICLSLFFWSTHPFWDGRKS